MGVFKFSVFGFVLACLIAAPLSSAHAGSCPESSAVSEAIKERQEQVKETYNAGMGDPEEDRSDIANCLGNIMSIGDVYSLGVKIPGMEQIVNSMCGSARSAFQSKISEALNQVKTPISSYGQAPFQVNGDPAALAKPLISKIK